MTQDQYNQKIIREFLGEELINKINVLGLRNQADDSSPEEMTSIADIIEDQKYRWAEPQTTEEEPGDLRD